MTDNEFDYWASRALLLVPDDARRMARFTRVAESNGGSISGDVAARIGMPYRSREIRDGLRLALRRALHLD